MKIGVLGTGTVGQTLATKLTVVGHDVMLGSRTANNEKALAWAKQAGTKAAAGTFEQTAASAEVVFNCTLGSATIEVLQMAKESGLAGKVLVDVSNPLDFSKGMPPSLIVCNTDSLGEQVQRAFPKTKVVKTLNTMWSGLMVNPRMLAETHVNFLCGNDAGAKSTVKTLLKSFGWHDEELVDLGDITGARGMEMWLPLWLRIFGATKSGAFNLKLVSAKTT
jgi:8-hydroxy-5-deazaflavin:NADPH oxidoreductase